MVNLDNLSQEKCLVVLAVSTGSTRLVRMKVA